MFLKRGLIVLRQSFDWSRIKAVDDLRPEKFDEKVLHPVGTTRRSIEAWNNAFEKTFFQTRHELKQLTLKNLRSLRNSDLELLSSRTKISSWRIILLSDDDDWVSPTWAHDLPDSRQGLLFCRWQSVRFNGAWYVRPNSRKYSFTNNCCVYPDARQFYTLAQIYQHFDQNKIHNQLGSGQVDYVDQPLSVTHKHPASSNTMRQLLLNSDWDIGVLRDSVKNYLEQNRIMKIPDSLYWARDLVEESCRIFTSLL